MYRPLDFNVLSSETGSMAAGDGCYARYASLNVYGTVAGFGSTVNTGNEASTTADILYGPSDGTDLDNVQFLGGYIEYYQALYGARDAQVGATAGTTINFADANTYDAPGANSLEALNKTYLESLVAASDTSGA